MPLKFVDDLPPSRRHDQWEQVAEQLRSDPARRWAHLVPGKDGVPEFSPRTVGVVAHKIRNGRRACFEPPGAFEATVRNGELYARYAVTAKGRRSS